MRKAKAMPPSVSYADYQAYGGRLPEGAFNASVRAAEAAVREVVGFNEPEGEAQEKAYRNAVCAAVDVDHAYGASGGVGEGASGMTIGSFSVSGGSDASGTSAYDLDMRRSIRQELSGSGLLYQGIG